MTIRIGANAYDQEDAFWEKYIKGRPTVPQSFFDLIFSYHSKHNGVFTAAHEVGAGVGVYSHRLAARFDQVLVSDIIPTNIEIARTRFQGKQYSFLTSSLENTINLPASSVNLVFASTMMHFTQVDAAVKAVHHQLEPGGTFAAGLYGTYALHDPEAQKIWAEIVLLTCEWIADTYGVDDSTAHVLQNEAAGLDSVELPEDMFEPAVRYHWNFPTRGTMKEMILPKKYGLEPRYKAGKKDEVVWGWERDWYSKLDINGLKGIVDTWPHDKQDPKLIALWEKLAEMIGNDEVEGAWMVDLLLATKK